MLATATSRAAHIRALTDLAAAKGYDGIDVDYEGMAAADRDRFSAFVDELASALHAQGRLLSVAVHAKTAEPGTWSGPQAQNYKAIGAAADRVRLMAYDYSWETSPAGPIAPLSWVDSVAAFAVTQIPAAKVELGMSLYGYDWVGGRGEGVTHDVVTSRLTSFGATRTWDSAAAEPTFSYTSGGSAHTVYYADAQSVTARLAVVDKHALAAAAFWRRGGPRRLDRRPQPLGHQPHTRRRAGSWLHGERAQPSHGAGREPGAAQGHRHQLDRQDRLPPVDHHVRRRGGAERRLRLDA